MKTVIVFLDKNQYAQLREVLTTAVQTGNGWFVMKVEQYPSGLHNVAISVMDEQSAFNLGWYLRHLL